MNLDETPQEQKSRLLSEIKALELELMYNHKTNKTFAGLMTLTNKFNDITKKKNDKTNH